MEIPDFLNGEPPRYVGEQRFRASRLLEAKLARINFNIP
jgi:hypothetical protein